MKKRNKLIKKRKDGMIVLSIGSSDENADWLKKIGNHQKGDLRATDEALEKYNKDSNA